MAEKKGLVPKGFAQEIERDLTGSGRHAISRRLALAYLEIPWREHVEKVKADRNVALSVAHVSGLIESHIQRYKALVAWLAAAQTRMWLSLSERPDMDSIVAESRRREENGGC